MTSGWPWHPWSAAWCRHWHSVRLSWRSVGWRGLYTPDHLIRGLPELLVVLFIYFGFDPGCSSSPGVCGVQPVCLRCAGALLLFASYATQTLAVPPQGGAHGATPGGAGARPGQAHLLSVSLPQAWRHARPGLATSGWCC